jgi:LysM domain
MTFPPIVDPGQPWTPEPPWPPSAPIEPAALREDAVLLAGLQLPARALLTLWDPDLGETVIFDPPPVELRTSASTTTAELTLDEFGTLSRPTGRNPTSYSWSGAFYGAARVGSTLVLPTRYRAPSEWRWLLEEMHRLQPTRSRALELHLEGADIPPFTRPVDIASLEFSYRGGSGDLHYAISLTERRHVLIGVETPADVAGEGETVVSETGEAGEPPIPQTINVRPGDTLSMLAKQHLGDASRWPELVALNGLTDEDVEALEIGIELQLPGGLEP